MKISTPCSHPELLAPGGDPESVRAAVVAGADAVYLGFSRFNARRRAKNLERGDFRELTAFAHAHGTRIYVTFNTLVRDDELQDLLSEVQFAAEAGADGFIVQDLGVAYLLRKLFPHIDLHASTQMTTHTSGQIRFLSSLGFSRMNLSRELSLREISALTSVAHSLGAATEVFVHGAYCASYSGQCLMSSYSGGQSGNRGICFQPCRRRYRDRSQPEKSAFLFSLQDNGARYEAESILRSGADALKIEGRVKGARYVRTATSFWRSRIDELKSSLPESVDGSELERIFNRGYHAGYFRDAVSPDMFVRSPLDRSRTVAGTIRTCRLERIPAAPDEHGTAPTEFATLGLEPPEGKDAETPAAETGAGYCISTEENRLIARAVVETVFPDGSLRLRLVKRYASLLPGQLLLLDTDGVPEPGTAPVRELQPGPPTRPVPAEDGTARESRPGGIALEVLHHVPGRTPGRPAGPGMAILVNKPADIDRFRAVLPDDTVTLYEAFQPSAFPTGDPVVPWFPAVMREKDCRLWSEHLRNRPLPLIVTGNASLALAARENGTGWIAGPGMGVSNSFALRALTESCGALGAVLSPELSPEQALMVRVPENGALWVTVYGPVLLMTLRNCPLARWAECGREKVDDTCHDTCSRSRSLLDSGNDCVHAVKRPGRWPEVYGGTPTVLPGMMEKLLTTADRFILDFRLFPFQHGEPDRRLELAAVFRDLLEGRLSAAEALDGPVREAGIRRSRFPWGLT